ncbi:MAG TPA: hypothetical protein VIC26_11505 [Marinagarivorans sp.]
MNCIHPIKRQRGLATVLIVLLVGVSMTAIAMGLASSVKSTQHKQTAVHAATHAQSAAWSAVTIFREYLKTRDYEDVSVMTVGDEIPISIAGSSLTLNASIVAVDNALKDSDGIKVTVNIRAVDNAARASSSIQVVYRVANTVCDLCQLLEANLDLYDDTNLGGDIQIKLPPGGTSKVNVDGDVNALSIALEGVTYLNATGNVTLGSQVPLQEVFTNGNLTLGGSANVDKASALGTVTSFDNGRADLIYANGDLLLGGGAVDVANTLGSVSITNWALHGSIIAQGDVEVNSPVQKVHSRGHIVLNAWADARDIVTEKTLSCPNSSWNMFDNLVAEIELINCPDTSATVREGTDVNVPLMDELQPFTRVRPTIDAWAVKSDANYVFEFTGGHIRVTVKNVNSIADGAYYLADYPNGDGRGHKDYLCDAVDGSGQCTSPAVPTHTLCQGQSTYDSCFSYDAISKSWTIDSKNIVPGVVWFDGDLTLSNGEYYNTFIVTGDISTMGAMKTYAPNYIGYNAICTLAYPQNPSADYTGLYPTQLCNIAESALNYTPLTNIVLMAGGYDPFAGGNYRGGDITLSASNELFGNVLAGNHLDTNGDTIVHGYISAAATKNGSGTNDLGGKTVLDLENLPPSYRPEEIPNFDGGSCTSTCNPPAEGAEVLWSRYL